MHIHRTIAKDYCLVHRHKGVLRSKLKFVKNNPKFWNAYPNMNSKHPKAKKMIDEIRRKFGYSPNTLDCDIMCHFNRLYHLNKK